MTDWPINAPIWNEIPECIKEQVVDISLEHPEKSPRELAWFITNTQEYCISESSVYRILKSYDLINQPGIHCYISERYVQTPNRTGK